MSRIPLNAIIVWTGLNSNIPAGYTRETTLDDKYPKGTAVAVDPDVTGGAETHTHATTANHTHTLVSHTHTIVLEKHTTNAGRAGGTQVWQEHTHVSHASGVPSGGSLSSIASTYAAFSNHPPYYEVIFIKSDGSRGVPDNGIALWDGGATLPTNWENCDGNNSTPDLRDKYLKGAGTGADAGGSGGSYTNIHDLTHTHTVAAHSHVAKTSPSTTPAKPYDGWGGVPTGGHDPSTSGAHTHSTTLANTTDTISGTPEITTTETVEPAYSKLMAIQNQNGQDSAEKGIVAMWLGALGDVPAGWGELTAMRERHLKISQNSTENGNTGGSNTHTHQGDSHTHSAVGTHTHVGTSSQHPAYNDSSYSPYYTTETGVRETTVHPVTEGVQTSTYSTTNTDADSQNNEPPFRTVAFIKLTQTADAGFLMNFL